MRKKYNTLSEEINRMKSLFTEERLYGNLVDKPLLTEANIYKFLGKAFSNASGPAVRSLGAARVNKALSTAINDFSGLSKHLDDFDDVWKAIGISDVKMNQTKGVIKNLGDIEKLGKLKEWDIYAEITEGGFRIIDYIPATGGLREMTMLKYLDATGILPPPSKYILPQGTNTKAMVIYRGVDDVLLIKVGDEGPQILKDKNGQPIKDNPKGKTDDDIIDIEWEEVKVDDLDGKNIEDIIGTNTTLTAKSAKDLEIIERMLAKLQSNGNKDEILEIILPDGTKVYYQRGKAITDPGSGGKGIPGDPKRPITEPKEFPKARNWWTTGLRRFFNPWTLQPKHLGNDIMAFNKKWNIRPSKAYEVILQQASSYVIRFAIISTNWSFLCGLIKWGTEEGLEATSGKEGDNVKYDWKSMCGNPLVLYQAEAEVIGYLFSWAPLAIEKILCGWAGSQELKDKNGEIITCELINSTSKEIIAEIESMDVETLINEAGLDCDELNKMAQTSNGRDEETMKIEIKKKVADYYGNKFKNSLSIPEDYWVANWTVDWVATDMSDEKLDDAAQKIITACAGPGSNDPVIDEEGKIEVVFIPDEDTNQDDTNQDDTNQDDTNQDDDYNPYDH